MDGAAVGPEPLCCDGAPEPPSLPAELQNNICGQRPFYSVARLSWRSHMHRIPQADGAGPQSRVRGVRGLWGPAGFDLYS